MARDKPAFQIGDHVYFKNKQPGKWDLKWRPGYQIVRLEHDGHFIHIENQATGKIRSCNVTDICKPLAKYTEKKNQFGTHSKEEDYHFVSLSGCWHSMFGDLFPQCLRVLARWKHGFKIQKCDKFLFLSRFS